MLIKMVRSQLTSVAMLRAGVAYDMSGKSHEGLAQRLLDNGFAVKTTKQQLAKDAVELAGLSAPEKAKDKPAESAK